MARGGTVSGFNTDINAQGEHYHVQTQETRAGVETLVYMGGQVVYARCSEDPGTKPTAQHNSVVGALQVGKLELFETERSAAPEARSEGGEGLLNRMAEFVRRYTQRGQRPPSFWIDTEDLRTITASGSGSITARLVFATGKPVAGATVEVEQFQLLGPATRLADATTDKDGSVTFDCELGDVRPVGLMLRSEWNGDETTARFLV